MKPNRYLLFLFLPILLSCSKKIYPDRSSFFGDGDPTPPIDLSFYRSVQERPGQDSTLAIAMSLSGGGHRAANLAVGVMLGLEELRLELGGDVLDEIDYLSSVSGGGFAGGAYIRALIAHTKMKSATDFRFADYVENWIRDDLRHSYAGTLLRANINPILWFSKVDDGDALEKAIDDRVMGYQQWEELSDDPKSVTLGEIFIPADSDRQVRYPMLITNSSEYHTMRIVPFTPDILHFYKISGYVHRLKHIRNPLLDPFSVPLSVGIKASGSFPVLISNTTLQSRFHAKRAFLHLVDGAMTDNFGYQSAIDVLRQDQAKRKVLFVVDADNIGHRKCFSETEGAISSISVYGRLSYSGIDANRSLVYRQIEELKTLFKVHPIVFNFPLLIKDNEAPLPPPFNLRKKQRQLIEKMRNGFGQLTDDDLQLLYEVVTRIATKYSIEDDEQELLFLTGRLMVYLQRDEILKAIKGD